MTVVRIRNGALFVRASNIAIVMPGRTQDREAPPAGKKALFMRQASSGQRIFA